MTKCHRGPLKDQKFSEKSASARLFFLERLFETTLSHHAQHLKYLLIRTPIAFAFLNFSSNHEISREASLSTCYIVEMSH
ncbi:hypothetical protein ACU8KH_00461 [Lachancea thermotolerans]